MGLVEKSVRGEWRKMKIKSSVVCPLCGEQVSGEINVVSRTDLLVGHLVSYHGSKVMPPTPAEGPPLPKVLGIKWPWRG